MYGSAFLAAAMSLDDAALSVATLDKPPASAVVLCRSGHKPVRQYLPTTELLPQWSDPTLVHVKHLPAEEAIGSMKCFTDLAQPCTGHAVRAVDKETTIHTKRLVP